jgi:hypothetical protein
MIIIQGTLTNTEQVVLVTVSCAYLNKIKGFIYVSSSYQKTFTAKNTVTSIGRLMLYKLCTGIYTLIA